jgi:hypothetical protein
MNEERNYEQEARDDGWVPQDDWKGDPEKHVDAKTFVERGEKISGILKSKIGRLEDRIDSLTQSNAEFKKYTDKQLAREHEKNTKLIADLERAKAQAITDGDGAAAVQAEKDIQSLQQEVPKDANAYNQLAQEWASENPWYATNQKLGRFADGIADQIVAQGYTGKAYFNELTRQVKEVFPEEFENPNRKKASVVEDGGTKEVSDSKAQTWANLPKEAKAAAKRFEKDIPGFTRDQFVSEYEWE